MVKFIKNLYIGKSVKNSSLVKWKLKHFAGMLQIYVIAICQGQDQLEFFHCSMLKQKFFKRQPVYVVGIASGKSEAFELVETIVNEVYQCTGSCKLKEYFMNEFANGRAD